MKRYNWIILFAVIVFNGCYLLDDKQSTNKIQKPKVVKVLELNKKNLLKDSREYPAEIYAKQHATMAFEVSGKIIDFSFHVGEKVKKGSLLAKLDDGVYKANVKITKANYERAKSDFNRYKQLYASKSISEEKFDQIRQAKNVTKAKYDIALENFNNSKLLADFDGIIAQKLVDDFARVTAKQPILILEDTKQLKVKFFVPENDIIKAKQNDIKSVNKDINLFVTLSSDENVKYKAKLIDIATKAEEITRTYEATALIERPKDKNILSGMTAKIKIYRKNILNKKIFIPLNAIFTNSSNNSFVWLISNNKVHKKLIKIGRLQKDSIEVLSGLSLEDKIAISGINLLDEDDEIQEYKKLGN